MTLDISRLILEAKIGRERKAAQEDTCGSFAAALYDVLLENGVRASVKTASFHFGQSSQADWYHAVVEVDGRLFDSMGEFSNDAVRARLKIHPKVETRIAIKPDDRDSCYDEELHVLHEFLVKELRKAIRRIEAVPKAA
jgi:hypothetical protein